METPIAAQADVVVVGGGPAGFSAAIHAARMGMDTILVEAAGQVGGVATIGLMSHWTGKTQGGFYEEVLERAKDGTAKRLINPEILKTTLLEMLQEAGVKLRLYTMAVGVIMNENTIEGIIVESKSGREGILGSIIVDASGDGDIAAKAGVPFVKGRPEDGKMQPMTTMFKVAGVDTERAVLPGSFESTYELPEGDLQTLAQEHLPFPAGHVLLYRSTLPGIITCNMTNCIDVDGTKAEDLTEAELVCRSQIGPIVEFLKRFVPGFENCYVISSASHIGVRETRHFEGEYTLTEQDILEAKVFEDWAVTKAHFNFDVHNLSGAGLDETGAQKLFPQQRGYTIPYRCFVPKNVERLLLAGRNISGTHLAHSNFRVMPICVNMGQAVGIAAALCVSSQITPRELDVTSLQTELTKQGVTASEPNKAGLVSS